ncbi:hypothetical protein HOK51_07700 [Candidatus Woesearchaeota archaeon]|jgi:hypothetical protein|nr:hypothetical protein [Candidatus Woesearchaeota archaeon]MBT6519708.1 hypothetical protein [Candidatus Woesearchaeota archaeon]MBT7368088.1 hypothetical protein [Candidatus Woesearchaeota archaeon]
MLQTTKANQANESFALKKLHGIKPKGVKAKLACSNFELLVDCYDFFIDYSSDTFKIKSNATIFDDLHKFKSKNYGLIKQKLENVLFTKNNLEEFILAKSNQDYLEFERAVVAVYSGILIDLLTERNKSEDKSTSFYFNGNGNRFDLLFFGAKNIGELIVDNFIGEGICLSVGADNGKVNLVAAINCHPEYGLFGFAGMDKGEINTLIAVGCSGKNTFINSNIRGGKTKNLVFLNNDFDFEGQYRNDVTGIPSKIEHAENFYYSNACISSNVSDIVEFSIGSDNYRNRKWIDANMPQLNELANVVANGSEQNKIIAVRKIQYLINGVNNYN